MITVSMLSDLNTMIKEEAPYLNIVAERHDMTGREWTYYYVRLKKSKYIYSDNHPLNITQEFKDDIEEFLSTRGINNLNWNNTYTTFWESE